MRWERRSRMWESMFDWRTSRVSDTRRKDSRSAASLEMTGSFGGVIVSSPMLPGELYMVEGLVWSPIMLE